jgi:hydrogenase 3 maturation protease
VKILKQTLKNRLLNAKKIAVLGVGSELRGDDVAGILVARQLGKNYQDIKSEQKNFKIFIGATAPENLTGEIKRFKPTHLVIVDSADMDKPAGTVKLINPDVVGGLPFCTHKLPIKILTDYLIKSIGCEIMIIGIQPKVLSFGDYPSKEVEKSAKYISATIKEILKE